jgi:shikimate dehydrogenase
MTPLLKQAKDLGLNILSGLDMLIEQARPSFKAFYGQLPPIEADPKPMLIAHLKSQ